VAQRTRYPKVGTSGAPAVIAAINITLYMTRSPETLRNLDQIARLGKLAQFGRMFQ
jgi:hypothetical protein